MDSRISYSGAAQENNMIPSSIVADPQLLNDQYGNQGFVDKEVLGRMASALGKVYKEG